jgi:hypothetical protein
METVARLVVVALVALPLVVLVVRRPRRNPAGTGRVGSAAHDEPTLPTDADTRRQLTDLAALADAASAQPPVPPSRFSAEIASWTA